MSMRYFPGVLMWFAFVVSLVCEGQQQDDLDKELVSWNLLKRDAGYFTESGIWRGGLWRSTKKSEENDYSCDKHTDTHCTHWSASGEGECYKRYTDCVCAETASPYCRRWECEEIYALKHEHCEKEGDFTECSSISSRVYQSCRCDSTALSARNCSTWSCQRTTAGRADMIEEYSCLNEGLSGEYCDRWKGNASSSEEVGSSACGCLERSGGFCMQWRCRERSLFRCAAHTGAWCHMEIAVCLAGGLGLINLLICGYLFIQHNPISDEEIGACANLFLLFFIFSTFFYGVFAIVALPNQVHEPYKFQICNMLFSFSLLCLPWLAGVLIWGGIPALVIVLPIWISVLLTSLMVHYCQKDRSTRPAPPSVEMAAV